MRLRAVLLGALALGCAREPDPRPNVLLISLDSVRADFVGAYGARLPHAPGRSPTPNLDRLAAEGVLFEDALSTTSWTLPAHVSLLTGEPELVHGVEQDGQAIPPELPTLAETLRERGYRTYGVYSGPYLDPRYGFERGFERYEAGYGPELARAAEEAVRAERAVAAAGADPPRARAAIDRLGEAARALELASHRDVSSQRVTDLVLAELERAQDDERPFFVFAHYFDPHYDYVAPAPFRDAFDPDYAGLIGPQDYFTNPAVSLFGPESPTGRVRTVDERGLEHIEALYAGEIAWTDSRIGIVLEALERLGLAPNTLVVVVSDHGDEFFEHGSIGHRQTLFEEVTRVPFILRLPGRLAPGERRKGWMTLSQVRDELVCTIDPGSPPRGPRLGVTLGRLVHLEEAGRGYPSIAETYRHGSIKLFRKPHHVFEVHPDWLDYRGLSEDEHLRWIDLDAHPDEAEGGWSHDFDDPRAMEALGAFRAAHADLVRQRHAPPFLQESIDQLAALRGLGYTTHDQAPRIGTLPADELVLPPPGEALLGSGTER